MPIWYKDQVLLSPSMALAMEGLQFIAVALLSPLVLAASKRMGRVLTIIVTRCIGISILLTVACIRPMWREWTLILPLMLTRMGIMNCTGALSQSIMNDYGTPPAPDGARAPAAARAAEGQPLSGRSKSSQGTRRGVLRPPCTPP